VRLQVAAARQEESGAGIARIPRSAFQKLGITEGDVVEIRGKRTTAAIAMAAYPEDDGLDLVRLDGLQRGNAQGASSMSRSPGPNRAPPPAWSSPRPSATCASRGRPRR
jgi:anaerobic selenocysteine-containing dehydrogenase